MLVANTQHFVLQAIVDFPPNIIQTYQIIFCVYSISVHLYSFENHTLVITQQFLVLHKGAQQQTKATYQNIMLVGMANLIIRSLRYGRVYQPLCKVADLYTLSYLSGRIMSYPFITEDPTPILWGASVSEM